MEPPKTLVVGFKPNTFAPVRLSGDGDVLQQQKIGCESPDNTEDFLTIIPKPTLLSKERAKKRLQAYGAKKVVSPVVVKKPVPPKVLEVKEEKFNEHGIMVEEVKVLKKPAKNNRTNEFKANNSIKEIEILKKKEEELEQPEPIPTPKSKSITPLHSSGARIGRRERELLRRHRKNSRRYPSSWADYKGRKFSLHDIHRMNDGVRFKETTDYARTLNFEKQLVLKHFSCKPQEAGQELSRIPAPYVRFTKSQPSIPFSVNFHNVPDCHLTVKQLQNSIPKRQRESVRSFIKRIGRRGDSRSPVRESSDGRRAWYSREMLSNVKPRNDYHQHHRTVKQEDYYHQHQQQNAVQFNYADLQQKPEIRIYNCKDVVVKQECDSKYSEELMPLLPVEVAKAVEPAVEVNVAKTEKKPMNSLIDIIAPGPMTYPMNTPEKLVTSSTSVEEECKEDSPESQAEGEEQIPEVESSRGADDKSMEVSKNGDEPNTDEYRSHWESEGEGEPEVQKVNNCWESDEEEKVFKPRYESVPKREVTERSLEMPLNINLSRSKPKVAPKKFSLFDDIETKSGLFMDDAWEKPGYVSKALEYEALEKERRSLNEERRKLEIEKQKIAEMERRILQGEMYVGDNDGFRVGVTKIMASYSNKKKWEAPPPAAAAAPKPALPAVKEKGKEDILEDEYEQFMRAVGDGKAQETSSSEDSSEDEESGSEITPLPITSSNSVTSTNNNAQPMAAAPPPPPPPPLQELNDTAGIDLDNRRPLNAIVLNRKSNVLDHSVFKESDESDGEKASSPKRRKVSSPERQQKVKKKEHSPIHRQHSPRRRDYSPKRRSHSTGRSKRSRYSPPRKRRDSSPQRRKHLSPRRRHSPPSRRRDSSPAYRRRYSRSSSKDRKTETIQQTLQRLAGMDHYDQKASPVNSPLDGFKRSLADSTISDEQLLQNQESYADSFPQPSYYEIKADGPPPSPKRIPLDDRINQVLGIEKDDDPKPITTTYSSQQHYYNYYNYDHFSNNVEYEQKAYEEHNFRYASMRQQDPPTKVLQVGNVLQVVPTDNAPRGGDVALKHPPSLPPREEKKTAQRILQVGNMLQIVPTTATAAAVAVQDDRVERPPVVSTLLPPAPLKQSAEDLMQLRIAERKAEREKRRQERERRRREKERKRKEREKRKQLKLKQKTEDMIKKALSIETEMSLAEDVAEEEQQLQWPPVSALLCGGVKAANKGILIRGKENQTEYFGRPKKGVKFADGIIPGEGTSPSGGEELSSPPPVTRALKEKRFTKTKKPKVKHPKKKIKVQIIRKRKHESDDEEEEEEEEDGLPPPSPPPGSPPPHVFPPRVKSAPPSYGASRPQPYAPPMPEALQPQNYPPSLSPLIRQPPKSLNLSIKPLPLQPLSSSQHG